MESPEKQQTKLRPGQRRSMGGDAWGFRDSDERPVKKCHDGKNHGEKWEKQRKTMKHTHSHFNNRVKFLKHMESNIVSVENHPWNDPEMVQFPRLCQLQGNMFRLWEWSYIGWWFGTLFVFPDIGNTNPNWLSYVIIFFRGVDQPPSR